MADRVDYTQVDVVAEHLTRAIDDVGRFASEEYRDWIMFQLGDIEYGPRLESPLEALFYLWWAALVGDGSYWGNRLYLLTQQDVTVSDERFRLDFVVWLQPDVAHKWEQEGLTWPHLAIEVDGHSFHEKTPEQVARRNHRDRLLQQDGWMVFHFSWSELTMRPHECIGQVLGVARERFNRIQAEAWAKQQAAKGAAE